jgi:hypothetical protein
MIKVFKKKKQKVSNCKGQPLVPGNFFSLLSLLGPGPSCPASARPWSVGGACPASELEGHMAPNTL